MILWFLLLFAQTSAPESSSPSHINSQPILEQADVRSLLESSDASQQAWGAWHAGQSRMQETIPLLEKLVEKRLPETNWVADGVPLADLYSRAMATTASALVVDAALDALIQLEAKSPADLISAIYQK